MKIECIDILLCDDHRLFLGTLRSLLVRQFDFRVVGEATSGQEALFLTQMIKPDVILMDIGMPGLNGIDTTALLLNQSPRTRIIAVTQHFGPELVLTLRKVGASGHITKFARPEILYDAIRTVARGKEAFWTDENGTITRQPLTREELERASLTPREIEIMVMMAHGETNADIASTLGIGVRTVETHRQRIFEKTRATSLPELVRFAIQRGLVSLD